MTDPNPRQQIKQHESWPRLLIKSLDAIAIMLGLLVLITWMPNVNSKSTILISLVAIGIFNIVAEFVGLYRSCAGLRLSTKLPAR